METKLDAIIKECCMVCGVYRCQNHVGWKKCDVCYWRVWDPAYHSECPEKANHPSAER